MKRSLQLELGAAVTVVALVGGWSLLRGSNHVAYTAVPTTRGDIDSTIAATGNVNAVVTVQVGSQVSGNIKQLFADFNTKVKKNQLIALIDPAIFEARVNQAKANVDSAKAALSNAVATVGKVQADVESAKSAVANMKAEVAKAQAATHDAELKYNRATEMLKEQLIATQDVDTAKATYDSAVAAQQAAEAQVDAAEHNVQSGQAQIEVAKAQVESAKAMISQNQAALAQAQLDLEHTRIFAPVDGTVISRNVDTGQTVAASLQAPTIFVIAQDLTKMQVDTNVDEADIGRVHMGQESTFTVDAYPGTVFRAKVQQIRQSPINTQNVVTYDVVLNVDNSSLKLLPGMTASVRILADTVRNVLQVPNAALRFRPPGETVEIPPPLAQFGGPSSKARAPRQSLYVQGDDGKPRAVKIVAGLSDGTMTEVKGGELKEGDRVIVGVVDPNAKPASSSTAIQPAGQPKGRGPAF